MPEWTSGRIQANALVEGFRAANAVNFAGDFYITPQEECEVLIYLQFPKDISSH